MGETRARPPLSGGIRGGARLAHDWEITPQLEVRNERSEKILGGAFGITWDNDTVASRGCCCREKESPRPGEDRGL